MHEKKTYPPKQDLLRVDVETEPDHTPCHDEDAPGIPTPTPTEEPEPAPPPTLEEVATTANAAVLGTIDQCTQALTTAESPDMDNAVTCLRNASEWLVRASTAAAAAPEVAGGSPPTLAKVAAGAITQLVGIITQLMRAQTTPANKDLTNALMGLHDVSEGLERVLKSSSVPAGLEADTPIVNT